MHILITFFVMPLDFNYLCLHVFIFQQINYWFENIISGIQVYRQIDNKKLKNCLYNNTEVYIKYYYKLQRSSSRDHLQTLFKLLVILFYKKIIDWFIHWLKTREFWLKLYLARKIGDKFTELSKSGFPMESFTANFLLFSSKYQK